MTQQTIDTGSTPNDGTGDTLRSAFIKTNDNFNELYQLKSDTVVLIKQASDFGVIDSTKLYLIDGVIDMGTTSLEIPSGGINLAGYDFNLSKLTSSEDNYTMFTSPVGGSGDILGMDYAIEVTGTNSQVYDLTSATGNDAFEFDRLNYNSCTSLGEINGYRQGLETGTGRFGGTPELTLSGSWTGGYFIDTSIVRGLVDGSYSLFKAGAGFSMASRFRSNQNIDLPTTPSFFDFSPSNFINPSTVQLDGCIISRAGVFDAEDITIIPNMSEGDLAAQWVGNNGIKNTFVGAKANITVEVGTVVGVAGTFVDLDGTWTTADLQHFDSPANGQLRHLGNNPREFRVLADLTVEGPANDDIEVKVVKWDDSASGFVDILSQSRQINSLSGGRNVAFFTVLADATLDQNDYIKFQITDNTIATTLTCEIDSFFAIQTR